MPCTLQHRPTRVLTRLLKQTLFLLFTNTYVAEMQVGFPRFDYGSNVLVILASVCPIRVVTSKFPWYTGSLVGPHLKDRRQIPKQKKRHP